MSTLIAFLFAVLVNFSGNHQEYNQLYMCNGLQVDNVERAIYTEYTDLWIVHFNFDDKLTNVVILDSCWQYRAYEISPSGIEKVEF